MHKPQHRVANEQDAEGSNKHKDDAESWAEEDPVEQKRQQAVAAVPSMHKSNAGMPVSVYEDGCFK